MTQGVIRVIDGKAFELPDRFVELACLLQVYGFIVQLVDGGHRESLQLRVVRGWQVLSLAKG